MQHEKRLLLIPLVISLVAAAMLLFWGLKPGLDLTGGSLLQVSYQTAPSVEQVNAAIAKLSLGEVRVQGAGTSAFVLRARTLTSDEHESLVKALGTLGTAHEDQFTSVGPTIGAELLQKGLIALGLVAVCIILFIAFAFRKVSKPVASWKYGIIAIVTLIHDILIPAGLFALLGHFQSSEVNSLFIVALLTLLGVSINNTIVVFDRIRENLARNESTHKREPFDEVVGRSIWQTLTRSINTSLTVIIMLVALYALGPNTTKDFALTLIVGMVAGTYSSIFLASPLLVAWQKWSDKK